MSRLLSKIIIWALNSIKIKENEKALITTALLRNIDALPIRDALSFDLEGTIMVRGKKLDIEQIQLLKQGADSLKNNYAWNVIEEQVLYEANKIALHQGITPDMIQFAKSAVWVTQQIEKFLKQITG